MTSTFFKNFRAYLKRNKFLNDGDSVLVGVSGGADSMVLAHLLLQLQSDISFSLAVAHVNYGLRGKESDAEEDLVRNFCAQKKIECHMTRVPRGVGLQSDTSSNFQSAARDFRYHYFTELARQTGATKILTAHHQDDQAETILANWLRGSSLRGLAGMRVARPLAEGITLSRPLLPFSKEELLAYAREEGVAFLEDSSNASDTYWRNRLRRELLPIVKNLRDGALEKIIQTGEDLREAADYFAAEAKKWLDQYGRNDPQGYWLPRPGWSRLPVVLRREILYWAITQTIGSSQNLVRDHIIRCEQIGESNESEGQYHLPNGFLFFRKGEDLKIAKN